MELENVDTNTQEEQVDTTEVDSDIQETEDTSTNADETVSQEDLYNKTFDEIDLDNPDMSLFAEKTNVEDLPEQPIESNKIEVESTSDDDSSSNPFAVDEDGYLVQKLVDRGKETRVTPEELFMLGNKGLNYEQRNAEMKPYKEYINVLKKNKNISIEDLTSLADLSNGKKEALKHLISKYDVDVYDVNDSEEQYTPDTKEYNSDPVADIWSDYQKQNPTSSEVVANAFNSIDESFREELYNERTFPLFADDVTKGVFEKLLPETQKIKALYPEATWLQAYSEANRRLSSAGKKKKDVPPSVNAPKDINPSHIIDAKSKADRIWDDPEAYSSMMRDQLII